MYNPFHLLNFLLFYYQSYYMPGFGVTRDLKRSGYLPPQNPVQFILAIFKYCLDEINTLQSIDSALVNTMVGEWGEVAIFSYH